MATDGSAVIWLDTAAGRQYSKITAKNDGADTVDVEDSFNIAAPGVNWAIGGKRATLDHADSRTLFVVTNGAHAGWIIELEDNQSLTSVLTLAAVGTEADGYITIRGNPSSGECVTVNQTASARVFDGALSRWRVERIKFTNSNATKTVAHGVQINAASTHSSFYRCIFGDATNRLNTGLSTTVGSGIMRVVDCEFVETTVDGLAFFTSGGVAIGCYIHDCDGAGIAIGGAADHVVVANCIVSRCSSATGGIAVTDTSDVFILNCTVDDNDASGIAFSSATTFGMNVVLGCQLTNNGTGGTHFGLNVGTSGVADYKKIVCDWNNFFGNAGGARQNITAGDNDTAVDPSYANAAAGNYEVGQSTRALGFPDSARTIGANQSLTNSFVDIGAAQRDETLGGIILGARRSVR